MLVTDATGAPPDSQRRDFMRISRTRAILLAILLIASWVLVYDWARTSRHGAVPAGIPRQAALGASPATSQAAPKGPWGELEITPITIEPPADFATRFSQADTSTWYFRDCTFEKLSELLKTCGLTDEQRADVIRSATVDSSINGLAAKPERSLVISLSRDARTLLYQVLAADAKNGQAEPFRHRPDPADDWFADSGLSEATVTLAHKLLYRRGTMEAFADVSAIVPALATEDERGKLFCALARQSALMVKLRIRPDSDVHGLIAYWGRGGREKEIGPLIESLSKVPGGFSLSVSQLLPRFARARAFTYPDPVDTTVNGAYDCHWTSLNFWNKPPDDRFTNPDAVAQELRTAYHIVDKPSQLGDVVFLLNEKGQGIHSATFVAEDIVFTKNGSNISAPWLLMKLPELVAYYETVGAVKVIIFRKNGI